MRCLSVGSDPVTSEATVGMAHEALLEEWQDTDTEETSICRQ